MIEFRGQVIRTNTAWSIWVTGQVWGAVYTGRCATKGCMVHVERVGVGQWELDPFRIVPKLPTRPEDWVSDHPYHPTPLGKHKPNLRWWFERQHGRKPKGKVFSGQCGVKGCVRHLREG